jgi:hypothetical protein
MLLTDPTQTSSWNTTMPRYSVAEASGRDPRALTPIGKLLAYLQVNLLLSPGLSGVSVRF